MGDPSAPAGIVYLFDGANGTLLLTIPDPEPYIGIGYEFGASVAAMGGNIIIGAPNYGFGEIGGYGRAYLFDGTTGALLLTIPNPNPGSGDLFGTSLAAIAGNILVGAPADNPSGVQNAGSAYLFDGTTGALLLTIPNPNPTPAGGDYFGISVAEIGGDILVGAIEQDPDALPDAGSVYLIDGTTGALLLTIPNPSSGADDFGFSVAAVGGNILVGAPLDNPDGVTDAGSAYVFDGTTVDLLLAIPTPALGVSEEFGPSVTAVGDNILVGTPGDSLFCEGNAGSVSLFNGATGALLHTISNPTPAGGDEFGISVAGMGESILVGAWQDKPEDTSAVGTAYLFETGTP